MRKKLVKRAVDLADLPPLSADDRAQLERLRAMPEEEIDTADIPELSDAFWKNAVRNPFYRPLKQQLTIRLDADVLAWLKSTGRGYQTKLNRILRSAMLREVDKIGQRR